MARRTAKMPGWNRRSRRSGGTPASRATKMRSQGNSPLASAIGKTRTVRTNSAYPWSTGEAGARSGHSVRCWKIRRPR